MEKSSTVLRETQSRFTLAVTGHRRLPSGFETWLPALMDQTLKTLAAGRPAVMLCGMAAGADLLAAQRALNFANWDVRAVLPYQTELFRRRMGDGLSADFAQAAQGQFDTVLDQCAGIEVLSTNADCANDFKRLYKQLGQALVERSTHMLALWNGQTQRLKGGTYDVMCMAQAAGHPLSIIHLERKIVLDGVAV